MLVEVCVPNSGIYRCSLQGNEEAVKPGGECLVSLDYGLDWGVARKTLADDGRIYSFRFMRMLTSADRAVIAENRELVKHAMEIFQRELDTERPAVKVFALRYSFGRNRIFCRYGAPAAVNLVRHAPALQRALHAKVHFWQLGAREAAAEMGCAGVCGRRACCCGKCGWRPEQPSPAMARSQGVPPQSPNAAGTCGKLKCCLAHECVEKVSENAAESQLRNLRGS